MKYKRTPISVGVIGHRNLGDKGAEDYAEYISHVLLSKLKGKFGSELKVISAMSEGADSILARAALVHDISLESVIPFHEFHKDFVDVAKQEKYQVFRMSSTEETVVNLPVRSNTAYKRSMEWLIYKSEIVVAIWDGKEQGSIGGTWKAIELCKLLRKKVIHIDSDRSRLNYYYQKKGKYERQKDLNLNQIINQL